MSCGAVPPAASHGACAGCLFAHDLWDGHRAPRRLGPLTDPVVTGPGERDVTESSPTSPEDSATTCHNRHAARLVERRRDATWRAM